MMTIGRLPDRSPRWRRRFACGYTLVELIVAITVLGIALSGLFPLTAILYRHLQPLKTPASGGYDCRTPARDGNTTGNVAYSQHNWYLTPYAGARRASSARAPNCFPPCRAARFRMDSLKPPLPSPFRRRWCFWTTTNLTAAPAATLTTVAELSPVRALVGSFRRLANPPVATAGIIIPTPSRPIRTTHR